MELAGEYDPNRFNFIFPSQDIGGKGRKSKWIISLWFQPADHQIVAPALKSGY